MILFFLFLSLLRGVFRYLNLDPIKSSFFLIFSLLSSIPLVSFSVHIWFSYFICLLFLRGVFVILVYFSSLSRIGLRRSYFYFFALLISLFIFLSFYTLDYFYLNLNVFYYSIYFSMLVFILLILIFFMNFTSYFLRFSGALRKV